MAVSAPYTILQTSRRGAPAFSLVGPGHEELLLMPIATKRQWLDAFVTMERLVSWLNRGGGRAEAARRELGP